MSDSFKPWGIEHKTFVMLMHLSQLSNFIIPFGGLILPIVMWTTNKEQSAEIDRHGKVILNWVLSALIYSVVCFILAFVLIGFMLFWVLGIVNVIFIVIGAIKANEGVLWPYPFSIKFFKLD